MCEGTLRKKKKKRVDKKSRKAEKGKKSKPEKEVDRLGSIQGADSSFSQVADYLHLKMEVPQRKDRYLVLNFSSWHLV